MYKLYSSKVIKLIIVHKINLKKRQTKQRYKQTKVCFDQYEIDYLGRIKFLHVEMPYWTHSVSYCRDIWWVSVGGTQAADVNILYVGMQQIWKRNSNCFCSYKTIQCHRRGLEYLKERYLCTNRLEERSYG